jgi:hypothetical protein
MTAAAAAVDSGWRFNKDYKDYEQVRQFLPAFMVRLAELEAAGKYRYNDSFKGHIPGIEGPSEDSAIYMLQKLEQWNAEQAREQALLDSGYVYVTELEAVTRYKHVVLVRSRDMGDGWADWADARLVPRDGRPWAVLPKGRRTNGYSIYDRRVLVLK